MPAEEFSILAGQLGFDPWQMAEGDSKPALSRFGAGERPPNLLPRSSKCPHCGHEFIEGQPELALGPFSFKKNPNAAR
jgi:hypothetical protein